MRKARIENGLVLEVLEADPFPPFHPNLVWVECGAEVISGYAWDGSVFYDPTPPRTLEVAHTERLAALAALRFQKETAGILINGAKVKTDRESQGALTGAYTSLKNGLLTGIDWKAEGGVWVSLTLAQVEPLAQAVAAHVQACFSTEKAHAQAIEALSTVAEVDAYDISTWWPS